jgi:hypothetical protein
LRTGMEPAVGASATQGGVGNEVTFTPEFVQSMAQCLHCARVARRHRFSR